MKKLSIVILMLMVLVLQGCQSDLKFRVLSSSMDPVIQEGAIVKAEPIKSINDLAVGDYVVYIYDFQGQGEKSKACGVIQNIDTNNDITFFAVGNLKSPSPLTLTLDDIIGKIVEIKNPNT